MQLVTLLPHPDGQQFEQQHASLSAGADAAKRLCSAICSALNLPAEAAPALYMKHKLPTADGDRYILASCSCDDAASFVTGWSQDILGQIDSDNLDQLPALYVRYQPTSSSMHRSSSGVGGGSSEGTTQSRTSFTQQGVQQVKGTVEKTCGWHQKTHELAARLVPCYLDPEAPRGVSFLLKTSVVALSDEDAANMTPEDIAAKQQAMTAVKDACIAAVISGVLHVYSHVTDSKGNKLPLTRSKVAQHLNKYMNDQNTPKREHKNPSEIRLASIAAWTALHNKTPAAIATNNLAKELCAGYEVLLAGIKSGVVPDVVLQVKNLPEKAQHQSSVRAIINTVGNQAADASNPLRMLLTAFKAGAGLGAGAFSTPGGVNPASGLTPPGSAGMLAGGQLPFPHGSSGSGAPGSGSQPGGEDPLPAAAGAAGSSGAVNPFVLPPVPRPARGRGGRGRGSGRTGAAAAAAAAGAGQEGSSGGGRGTGGRGRGRGRGRQGRGLALEEGVVGPEPVLDNDNDNNSSGENDGSGSSSDEEDQGADDALAELANAAAAVATEGAAATGRGMRKRKTRSSADSANPDDYVMSEDEDQQRVARLLGDSTAAAASGAAGQSTQRKRGALKEAQRVVF